MVNGQLLSRRVSRQLINSSLLSELRGHVGEREVPFNVLLQMLSLAEAFLEDANFYIE
jgi:hypothetical protein